MRVNYVPSAKRVMIAPSRRLKFGSAFIQTQQCDDPVAEAYKAGQGADG